MNEATLANGGKLSGIITLPAGVALSEAERSAMLAKWESRHVGARRAGKIAIMTGGADFKQLSQSMVDLQMVDLRRFDAAAICAAIGVPGELAGLNAEAQYAHGPAQQRFIINTVLPMLAFVGEHITRGILPRFRNKPKTAAKALASRLVPKQCGRVEKLASFRKARTAALTGRRKLYLWFVAEDHPTIQAMIQERADKVLKYTESGIPLNAIIKTYDLPFEEVPWGNDWWIQPSLVPARLIMDAGSDILTGTPYTEEDPAAAPPQAPAPEAPSDNPKSKVHNLKLIDDPAKLRLWKNWVISWAGIEKEYAAAMKSYFQIQQRLVIANLKRELDTKGLSKADDSMIARIVFDVISDKGKLRAINEVHVERAAQLGIMQQLAELTRLTGEARREALDAVTRSQAIRSTINYSSLKLSGVGRVTQRRLASSLSEGLDKNESLNDLTDRVRAVLGENRARALSIARTQTGSGVSAGRQAGMEYAGASKKAWITSGDEVVRKLHVEAGRLYADGIDVKDAFWVGGDKLLHPGDPHGSAANVINCRCVAVPVAAKSIVAPAAEAGFYQYQTLLEEIP
jgi:hypothetical protein